MNIYEKLLKVQLELNVPKNNYNKFGNFYFRNAEDIIEGVKPLLEKYGLLMSISDDLVIIGDRYYVKSQITLRDIEDEEKTVYTTGYARESENKKGMDDSQVTGSTSSYARKYALNGLFATDDTKDADSMNNNIGVSPKTEKSTTNKKQSPQSVTTTKVQPVKDITLETALNSTITFGKKYNGKKLKDCPESYLEWMMNDYKTGDWRKKAKLVLQWKRTPKKSESNKTESKLTKRESEIKELINDNPDMRNMLFEFLKEEKPKGIKSEDFGINQLDNDKYDALLKTLKTMRESIEEKEGEELSESVYAEIDNYKAPWEKETVNAK
jgi:uncharacterized protein (DUF3820 family)